MQLRDPKTTAHIPDCPSCQGDMKTSDIPQVYTCKDCLEPFQFVNEALFPLAGLLEKNALGDDRIRRAVSPPQVSNIRSFLDIQENIHHAADMEKKTAEGGLRVVLSQILNRLETAEKVFVRMGVASDEGEEGLIALREAMELVSPLPSANRGVGEGRSHEHV